MKFIKEKDVLNKVMKGYADLSDIAQAMRFCDEIRKIHTDLVGMAGEIQNYCESQSTCNRCLFHVERCCCGIGFPCTWAVERETRGE